MGELTMDRARAMMASPEHQIGIKGLEKDEEKPPKTQLTTVLQEQVKIADELARVVTDLETKLELVLTRLPETVEKCPVEDSEELVPAAAQCFASNKTINASIEQLMSIILRIET